MSDTSRIRSPGTGRLRRVWLATGLILFFYVTTHLLNHALGLFGLGAMDRGERLFTGLWQTLPATVLLYGALLIHMYLALRSLYRRRQLRMRWRDALQLILGLAIPALLAVHAIDTRLAEDLYGAAPSYDRIVLTFSLDPRLGGQQVVLLLVAWIHGCMGIHFWARLQPWHARWAPVLFAGALLVPVLALTGYLEALREVAALAGQPGWIDRVLAAAHATDPAISAGVARLSRATRGALAVILALVLVARLVRNRYERRHQSVRVTYPIRGEVTAPLGYTLLEISRSAGIPHASVCGGRGRCSTCRVRVVDGFDAQPGASESELAVLRRVGAAPDVRLACQLRPASALKVVPLLPAGMPRRDTLAAADYLQGDEREICVLFADLRGFTRFSERKLPYDIVFFLNRYFDTMARAIEEAGGVPNQFTGDGVMALFGIERGAAQGCRDAIAAAAAMVEGLARMSADLAGELDEPLRMGIGVHCGATVVGRMGHGVALYLTAVGDTVHVASRLQDLTKEYACSMIISEAAAERGGIDVAALPRHEITVRNRSASFAISTIADVPAFARGKRVVNG